MPVKFLNWMGSTREDLTAASESVRQTMGSALRAAQQGGKSQDAEPMKGDLRDVMEIRDSDDGKAYRLMYTTTIGDTVYVLDFFPKKSKTGTATPKLELDRIRTRLKKAREHHAAEAHRG
jgi:phage-related protein